MDSSYVPSSENSELIDININSKFHELSPYITKDGLTLYFSRNNYTNNKYLEAKDGVNKLKFIKVHENQLMIIGVLLRSYLSTIMTIILRIPP